jgi:hypothetical protein
MSYGAYTFDSTSAAARVFLDQIAALDFDRG